MPVDQITIAARTDHSALVALIEQRWMDHHAASLTETKMTGLGSTIPKRKTRADLARSKMLADELLDILQVACHPETPMKISMRLQDRMAEQGMTTTFAAFDG